MNVQVVRKQLEGLDSTRPVIVIVDGITHFVSSVYVWPSTDDPKNDPVELELLDIVEPEE